MRKKDTSDVLTATTAVLVDALAVFAGYFMSLFWARKDRYAPVLKSIAVAMAAAVLVSNAKLSWHAISRTEYDGVSAALAEVAARIGPDDIVVTDHPWWGTPLALIHGKQVLDGREFYTSEARDTMKQALAPLDRLRRSGRRVLFVTSTAQGMEIFPRKLRGVTLDWVSAPFAVRELIHSRHARDFVLREKPVIFQIYAWHGRP